MKSLQSILFGVALREVVGTTQQEVTSIQIDSRKIIKGAVFVAIKGLQADGHSFIPTAIEKGASVIVCENKPASLVDGLTYIMVENAQEAVAIMAHQFYDEPSTHVKLVGVTGTNGKTTVATLLYKLFSELGYTCGLISTVQNHIGTEIIAATHTTPDAIQLNALLHKMVEAGCTHVFMEVSSHAIHQHRITGLQFVGGAFTNITHDHLDYHKTFDEYIKAKKKLFDEVNEDAFALTNKDDKNGMVMLQNTKATRYNYGIQHMADFKAKIMESDFNGMLLNIDGEEAWFRLVGEFNAYNLLLVYGTAYLLGRTKEEIITKLSSLGSVKGRFDYIRSNNGIIGIVDYAHTPDALENVLTTINKVRTGNEELITVIGCGGNRDAAKRPIMAEVASNLSTRVILTSDNPRNEEPDAILDEMSKGVPAIHYKKTLRITDRKEAIKTAVSMAQSGDIILVAGKGHENYQEIKGVKHPFDDKSILNDFFQLFQS